MVKEKKLSKKRRKQIARNAKRAAQKQIRKYGSVTKPLKVQVAATWKRLVTGVFGIVLLWFAYSAFVWDGGALALVLTVVFGLLGVALLVIAFLGDKKTVDSTVDGLDVLDALIQGLF